MGKKFLIIRFSSIGDIVLTTPLIRCLKLQLPGSQIHYLTKPAYKEILEPNPYLEKVHILTNPEGTSLKNLKKENFDFVIDLHHNLRSLRTKFTLGKKSSSFPKLNFEKWLLVNFKINRLPDIHIVDRYFSTLKSFGISNDQKGLDFFIPESTAIPQNILDSFASGKKYFAWAIGGKFATKRFPSKKIIEVINSGSNNFILLGGSEDQREGENIEAGTGGRCLNLCGKLSLPQSALCIKNADALLTNDTGLMHIGAALKKKIISFWGNTIPEFGMYPYETGFGEENAGILFEEKDLSCRPCSKLGYAQCPKKHFKCMENISTEEVAKTLSLL